MTTPDDAGSGRFTRPDPPPADPPAATAAPLIDSHAHLDMLPDVDGALTRMRQHGVAGVVTIGVDRASSRWAVRAARVHPGVRATIGLHPHDAKDFDESLAAELTALAAEDAVAGIGETGLDHYYEHSPRRDQRQVFAWHVGLAHRVAKPLVIHCRDAFDEVFAVLDAEGVPQAGAVFHCWSGGPDDAERALARGCHLSFSGTVTFRNAEQLRDAARSTPVGRLLVETDAPFLAPVPFRGRTNEPAYVRTTARFLAAVKGVAEDELAAATTRTAARLFGLPV